MLPTTITRSTPWARAASARSNSRKSPSTSSSWGTLGQLLAQQGGESGILLDRDQRAHAGREPRREGAGAGPDLDHDVVLLEPAVLDDPPGEVLAHQEVLAHALERRETALGQGAFDARELAALGGGPLAQPGGGAKRVAAGAPRGGHGRSVRVRAGAGQRRWSRSPLRRRRARPRAPRAPCRARTGRVTRERCAPARGGPPCRTRAARRPRAAAPTRRGR